MSHKPTYLLRMAMTSDPKEFTMPRGLVRQLLDMLDMPREQFNTGHEAIIDYLREQIGDDERRAHVAFLVPYLHYDGQDKDALNPDVRREALMLCDGYGKTDKPELLYDWSHVRDSTVEALAEARRYIEAALEM